MFKKVDTLKDLTRLISTLKEGFPQTQHVCRVKIIRAKNSHVYFRHGKLPMKYSRGN